MFKVGDEVIVNLKARGHYAYTTPGSRGRVTRVSSEASGFVEIKFNILTSSDKPSGSWVFSINAVHVSPYNETPLPEQICNKIKQMEERHSLKRSH